MKDNVVKSGHRVEIYLVDVVPRKLLRKKVFHVSLQNQLWYLWRISKRIW